MSREDTRLSGTDSGSRNLEADPCSQTSPFADRTPAPAASRSSGPGPDNTLTDLPSPPRSEGPAVPAFHRFGLHHMHKFFPTVKELREHYPEDSKSGAELTVSLPPARRAIQLDRQLALDGQQLRRRHRPRREQRPAELESISQELEQDTQATAQRPEETQGSFHACEDTGALRRNEPPRTA